MDKTVKIVFDKEFFDIKDTLYCGQIFRFVKAGEGYLVFSADKCAYCYEDGTNTVIECSPQNERYFYDFFDLSRDYSVIAGAAENFGIPVLSLAAKLGKGVRILNQNSEEALFSFVISQNNNIPRIKGLIEKLCAGAGEERFFYGEKFGEKGFKYRAFPAAKALSSLPESFFTSIGLGYRAGYIKGLADKIAAGYSVEKLSSLSTENLRNELISIKGVGPKVADCAVLFGFHRADSFPADTWIEKVYREDFGGTLKDRKKISEYFLNLFGENSGYFQQYLFYYKRTPEKERNLM